MLHAFVLEAKFYPAAPQVVAFRRAADHFSVDFHQFDIVNTEIQDQCLTRLHDLLRGKLQAGQGKIEAFSRGIESQEALDSGPGNIKHKPFVVIPFVMASVVVHISSITVVFFVAIVRPRTSLPVQLPG